MRIKLDILRSFVRKAIEENYDEDKEELDEKLFIESLREYIKGSVYDKEKELSIFRAKISDQFNIEMYIMIKEHKKNNINSGIDHLQDKLLKYKEGFVSKIESPEFREEAREKNPDFSNEDFVNIAKLIDRIFADIYSNLNKCLSNPDF